jgi:hypothetical protein
MWGDAVGCSDLDPTGQWLEALRLMQSALEILDDSEAPGDAGSHLDVAISRLERLVGSRAMGDVHQLRRQIEEGLILAKIEGPPESASLWDERS